MVEKGFKNEAIAVILPMFDFLTIVDRNEMEKGVEYIRLRCLITRILRNVTRGYSRAIWTFTSKKHG
jgi:hypothetical protein